MATVLKESVIHWRKKLEKHSDEEIILNVIRKLSKIPITLEILEETHIGRCIRKLSKRQDIVGEKALAVLEKWRVAFTNCKESNSKISSKSSINSRSKKENINKKSTSKYDLKHEKSTEDKEKPSLTYSERKQRNGSAPQSYTHHSSMNCEYVSKTSEQSSPSLYTYEKKEALAKYMDYDPQADINQGYNPECPEMYPASNIKTTKTKKSDSFTDIYNPSSVKHKLSLNENTESKAKYKKQKTGSHSKVDSTYDKQSALKKEKHCLTHKYKDTFSPNTKKESSDKTKHKSSSYSRKSKNVSSEKTSSTSKTEKEKLKINCAEEFTSSEVRFEDCLSLNDLVIKKKSVKSQSTSSSKKPFSNCNKTSVSSSSSHIKKKVSKRSDKSTKETLHLKVPKPTVKIDEVDIVSTLPEIQPNYRPLPQKSQEFSPSKKKVLSNEEAIKFTSSRREKTAVYSGRKTYFTEVPTLFESCTRVLIENIDAIEHMGGVPYFLLKPVLERCSPDQLFSIEHYNPYLLEDTHELWEVHCKRDYRLLTPQENETWRELYLRAQEEREKKFRNVTANISASMSKSNPVRQVKLAYVDSVAKPPRDVARRQAKHGTALPVNHTVKAGPPLKATPRPTAPVINSTVAASTVAVPNIIKQKPKVAPLMAKTLKSMKMCFRR